ncbi:MAG: NapC/NirT family cytochrome c, partial [Acidobacteriota bacterium]
MFKSKLFWGLVSGCLLTGAVMYVGVFVTQSTSTNTYCQSCHVHPQATATWKQGPHFRNPSGVVVGCVDCHLPPEGLPYFVEKTKAGVRDIYGYYLTDLSEIDWESKRTLDEAGRFTFEEACLKCHQELFPTGLSDKGVDAHLHYRKNRADVRCINCHLWTGHFHEGPEQQMQISEEMQKSIQDMLSTSFEQEEILDKTQKLNSASPQINDAALKQSQLQDNTRQLIGQLIDLSKKTFFVSSQLNNIMENVMSNMQNSINHLENRNASQAANEQRRAMAGFNSALLSLQESQNRLSQSSSSSG